MAANFTDISVSARLSELPGLMQKLAEVAQRLGIPADDSLRLQLIVEELFTNTVTHGFRQDCAAPVTLSLAVSPSGPLLRYADSAPAYDPSQAPEQVASGETSGGLGITLIRGMSQTYRYRRLGDRNVSEIQL
jgi:serine/threonine-protein kinase RsbW